MYDVYFCVCDSLYILSLQQSAFPNVNMVGNVFNLDCVFVSLDLLVIAVR